MSNVQTARLLLLFCGATRANYWIRTVSPRFSGGFAQKHDQAVMRCLGRIMRVDPFSIHPSVHEAATLPFSLGGLGIRSAFRSRSRHATPLSLPDRWGIGQDHTSCMLWKRTGLCFGIGRRWHRTSVVVLIGSRRMPKLAFACAGQEFCVIWFPFASL